MTAWKWSWRSSFMRRFAKGYASRRRSQKLLSEWAIELQREEIIAAMRQVELSE